MRWVVVEVSVPDPTTTPMMLMLYGYVTVTVTDCPAVHGWLGDTVMPMLDLLSDHTDALTVFCTVVTPFASDRDTIALRAPSRAAFVTWM